MLQFIIDGYNLVHKIPDIKNSSVPCHELLSFLHKNKLTGSLKNKVLVVFDGGKPPYQINNFHYKVLFSYQESADDLIIAKIKQFQNKKQIVVVTDDRELRYRAQSLEAQTCSVDDFMAKARRIKPEQGEKEINYSLQREITEEMKRIWLDDNKS
ncbi:MAG: NYN domain-containing protein [Candidatus Omnitrophica bacterium]|nr:NYN domain-containing protein [Candidatus Omnitrophota bacterium]